MSKGISISTTARPTVIWKEEKETSLNTANEFITKNIFN